MTPPTRLLGGVGAHRFDPLLDVSIAEALLRQASDGEIGPTVRIYRPVVRTAAFGRVDVRRPGIQTAAQACRNAGYVPVIRSPGGQAVVYTPDAVAIDHVYPESDPGWHLRHRFAEYGALIANALRGLGIDAQVGEVPGEYCPGEFSVNARGAVKLVGTAQRVVRNAWLFSAVVIVDGVDELTPLLRKVYGALDTPFEDSSVGSVRAEVPELDALAVENAMRMAYASGGVPLRAPIDEQTMARARTLRSGHVLARPGGGPTR